MSKVWSPRDESRFLYLKRLEMKRGKSRKEAAELAALAVSEEQQKEGRFTRISAGATGNPNTALEDRTVAELRNIASNLNINVRSKSRKAELVNLIRSRRKLGAIPKKNGFARCISRGDQLGQST